METLKGQLLTFEFLAPVEGYINAQATQWPALANGVTGLRNIHVTAGCGLRQKRKFSLVNRTTCAYTRSRTVLNGSSGCLIATGPPTELPTLQTIWPIRDLNGAGVG